MTQAAPMAGYALVTPARNERVNLERLAESVLAQELTPVAWIIVDDASDDGTGELAQDLSARHAWIRVVATDRSGDALAAGRRQGRALDSFRRGVEALAEPVEVVVKVDADTSFDPGYFRAIVERFAAEPDLGIAGGACYELEDGEWVRQKVVASHPRGASRAYRWPLIADVMALESRMGWDGLDEVKARMRGYRSAVLLDLAFRHHRPTGARERDRLRHFAAQGRAAWYMGYRPSYLLLRTLYRTPREPAAVGMVWGFAAAGVARERRCPEPDVIRHLRKEQRVRAVLRQGAPP
jgi:glycosyltransferase involved in cell wall biosynthesis